MFGRGSRCLVKVLFKDGKLQLEKSDYPLHKMMTSLGKGFFLEESYGLHQVKDE